MEYGVEPGKAMQVENAFTYHSPNADQVVRYKEIRDTAKNLAVVVLKLSPPSREQSLALTALEEAVMWTNAAIARNEK